MGKSRDGTDFIGGKVFCPLSRVKIGGSEIERISTRVKSRTEGLDRTRRSQEFQLFLYIGFSSEHERVYFPGEIVYGRRENN